jgi:lysine 2,3-aminomutase
MFRTEISTPQTKEESPDGEPPLVKDWNDWTWQIKNSITSLEELSKYITLTDEERQSGNLPLRITPYYARLLSNPAIRKCIVPTARELEISLCEQEDSLAEERDRKTEHIIHRYLDRVLFLTTNICASNCRYCTRSRLVENSDHSISHSWGESLEYIKNHSEIRDVLLSGGDPLLLNDSQLTYLLEKLYEIKHVEMVRIGTKVPVVLPQRITKRLADILSRYSPLYISIHFTHPAELTVETRQACRMLTHEGHAFLGSQTVCLNGVNDNPEVLGMLFKQLLTVGVKPYYCYACDLVPGSSHFRVPMGRMLGIIDNLRGWISGYAIPHFVIDGPDGRGKTPILPDYFIGQTAENYLFRNYKGEKFTYPA